MNMPNLPEGFPSPAYQRDGEDYISIRDLHEWLEINQEFIQYWRAIKNSLHLKEGVDYEETKDEDHYNRLNAYAPMYTVWMIVYCCKNRKQKVDTCAYLLDCAAQLKELLSAKKSANHHMT
jgi:hypothetical protein|nr:MAG TPA: AntA/AntB antirepressor [Caudoviricetes sp.]